MIKNRCFLPVMLSLAGVLSACTDEVPTTPTLSTADIAKIMPSRSQDKASWASDIASVFDELKLHKDKQNICTVIAVIDQ